MKFGNLKFLEPSRPLQACNGTALPYRPDAQGDPAKVTTLIKLQLISWFYVLRIFEHINIPVVTDASHLPKAMKIVSSVEG
jgi:hypothetical protein